MASKADFNAQEWSTVVEAPVLAGMRVVRAGRGGTIRESLAIGKVYTEARKSQGQNEFLDELVASPPTAPQDIQPTDDPSAVVKTRLREALRIVDEKGSPDDADAYRTFIVAVGRAAAEAHKEGGFIGIGGKRISEEEQKALDEIQAELDAAAGS
jgi:hypothetical protein